MVLRAVQAAFDTRTMAEHNRRRTFESMDASLIEELITKNKPFKIQTAAGRVFEVPHRDFISFSTRKTSLIISYEENGTEHFAIVPLLTITSAMAPA
jgi:hypothetical protein